MSDKTCTFLAEFFLRNRILFFLAAILGFIIGGPFLDEIFRYRFLRDVLLTFIFVAGIFAISRKRSHVFIALGLAIPMVAGIWTYYWSENIRILMVGQIFGALFAGFTISCLTSFIYNEKEVTKEVIYAAVAVYLLLAITWAFAYFILEYFSPASYSYPEGRPLDFYHFIYFSYVTITTLGYGDILPLTQKASALAILEAVTGQMYLVVVVAWLVGMHVSRRKR
jgi:voltage-gated potassium channel